MEQPDLLRNAQRRATVRFEESYAWISPSAVLILKPQIRRGCLWLPLPLSLSLWRAQQLMHAASRVDFTTGQEVPLNTFNHLHVHELLAYVMQVRYPSDSGKMIVKVAHHAPPSSLSPDGNWLLWQRRFGSWRAATLDGSETVDWPLPPETLPSRDNPSPGFWLPDSHRWLETVRDYVEHKYTIPTLLLRHRLDTGYRQAITVHDLDDGLVVGITHQPALLMRHLSWPRGEAGANDRPALPATESFSEVDLTGNIAAARRFEITLPSEGTVWEVRISPDGKHLAWLIQAPCTAVKRAYSLWTSDLNGIDFAYVGWVKSSFEAKKRGDGRQRCHFPRDVRWSPNGQSISFVYGDDLYTIPT